MSDLRAASRHETPKGDEPGLTCFVCERPLAAGGSVLFEGDRLVHAICWREGPPPVTVRRAA